MIPPGFEPGTACVLDRSDNQLHHRTIVVQITNHRLSILIVMVSLVGEAGDR